jgi:hypothetical protein
MQPSGVEAQLECMAGEMERLVWMAEGIVGDGEVGKEEEGGWDIKNSEEVQKEFYLLISEKTKRMFFERIKRLSLAIRNHEKEALVAEMCKLKPKLTNASTQTNEP